MRLISIFILSFMLCANSGISQLEPSVSKINFGDIERATKRVQEISIRNSGTETVTLLRAFSENKEYDVRTESRTLEPGLEMKVRIKLNPISKGERKDELQLLFNTETVQIKLLANVEYVDPANNTPCPDFEKRDNERSSDWKAYFKVVNRETQEIIPRAEIRLSGKAGTTMVFNADKHGELLIELPIDFYTIKAKKEGFARYKLESYINRRNKDFLLELMPGANGSVVILKAPVPDREEQEEEVVQEPSKAEIVLEEEQTEFSLNEYKPVNAVFLVDVSTSMRQEKRMDILKSSMIELADILRPDDIISIVTYASTTRVVLDGKPASDKERIKQVIEELKAEGMTAGEAGLKKAYKTCERHMIEGGNNQVYLATDGAFNKGSEKIKRLIAKQAKRNIQLSILAIRSSKWADNKMKELATAGEGRHLSLENTKSSAQLKELVKSQSKR